MAIGEMRQDVFSIEQMGKALAEGKLSKGRYELDVGASGDCKLTLMQKRWVQKSDLVQE